MIRLILVILIFILTSCSSKSDFVIFFEAESGEPVNMEQGSDNEASNGKYLAMADSGRVEYQLEIPENGYYEIEIRYRTSGGDKEQYLIRNDIITPIGFGIVEDWNIFSQPFE